MPLMSNQAEGDSADSGLDHDKSAAVIILAHNEASVIEETVRSLHIGKGFQDVIHVIADHCQDDTAVRALNAWANVMEIRDGFASGKGTALKWFVSNAYELFKQHDLVVILDADNHVSSDFWLNIKKAYPGNSVMQCLVQPVGYQGSPLSTLIALSEIHEQKTVDALRVRFGWPVRLRGTGMVMAPGILKQVSDMLDTEVEDIALSLLFTARGIPVRQNRHIRVFDLKPRESVLASRQRARWFRGQWAALWRYRREVLVLLKSGPAGWSLLSSLFLKPRWLLDAILLLMAIIALPLYWPLAALFLVKVLFDLACLAWTILSSENRNEFLKAILYIPGFIFMWMRGFLLAFRKYPWLRARE